MYITYMMYPKFSHQHVSTAIQTIFRVIFVQEHKGTNVVICVITPYLLTPRCRVLPEQLTCLQLVKKFPAFHGTRRFITALTNVRHLSLS